MGLGIGRSEETMQRAYDLIKSVGIHRAAKEMGIAPDTVARYARIYKNVINKADAKILLLDIETAPMMSWVWSLWQEIRSFEFVVEDWYCLSWAAKWLGEKQIMCKALPDYSLYDTDRENDSALLKDLWLMLDNCDIVIGHNCVSVDTPVLKRDLTWVPAGDLKAGDKLVGFDEGLPPENTVRNSCGKWKQNTGNRALAPSEVTDITISAKPCVEVVFENGDRVVTTTDHYWLGKAKNSNSLRWKRADKLAVGERMIKYFSPWEPDMSYDSGWLSGFLAGEGTVSNSENCQTVGVQFCQRPGKTWEQAIATCGRLGIKIATERTPHKSGIGKQDTLYTGFLGGKFATIENIGKLQVKRFIDRIDWNCAGGLKGHGLLNNKIVEVKDVGMKSVAVFGTTTKTFFGAGYAMHNCKKFDIRKLNARFILNEMTPPSPYRTIDTLIEAKKHFQFSSNRLDALARMMGVGCKVDTNGFELWKRCIAGDPRAWETMKKYNKHDIVLLEGVYEKMRPYMSGHPNIGVYSDGTVCSKCGSSNIFATGKTHNTDVSRYDVYECRDCGGFSRARTSKKDRSRLLTKV